MMFQTFEVDCGCEKHRIVLHGGKWSYPHHTKEELQAQAALVEMGNSGLGCAEHAKRLSEAENKQAFLNKELSNLVDMGDVRDLLRATSAGRAVAKNYFKRLMAAFEPMPSPGRVDSATLTYRMFLAAERCLPLRSQDGRMLEYEPAGLSLCLPRVCGLHRSVTFGSARAVVSLFSGGMHSHSRPIWVSPAAEADSDREWRDQWRSLAGRISVTLASLILTTINTPVASQADLRRMVRLKREFALTATPFADSIHSSGELVDPNFRVHTLRHQLKRSEAVAIKNCLERLNRQLAEIRRMDAQIGG